ncbi:hypothetical protein [Saccharospirillum sp. MSK14-1]|uniref:hypothetical protein n=1 Tax=Saccharospirillum sp. MSK14-1 TaxID=1897632 RepID=UPI0011B21FD3|nr:hypothetical protein [Saccharospirillum sp. MSK14-1]
MNIITAQQQCGKSYPIIATLCLPSVWSTALVDQLQVGLAQALAVYFDQSLSDILVMTQIVQSGHVVEAGQVQYF